ncbi:NMT1/THI5 like-domain-containing protein [Hyaloraphidium curvatum]|nr:NMT1/THI5 like-domain-containing protein [Hyaloraphidium curvatum]
MSPPATPIRVALDWTPNTLHSGFFVALDRGLYAAAALDVSLVSPAEDAYKVSPARKLAAGDADFAVAPSETAIAYALLPKDKGLPRLTAVAALAQKDTSAVVVRSSSGIERPAHLDGKSYASYNARFEGHIVRALVRADGGKGDVQEVFPPRLGIWDTVLNGEADSTWVFLPWEGVQARRAGKDLRAFGVEGAGVPYGYTPILLARHGDLEGAKAEALKRFMEATAEGYRIAAADPGAVAAALAKVPELAGQEEFLAESMAELAPAVLNGAGKWGVMEEARWAAFLGWLGKEGLLTAPGARGGKAVGVPLEGSSHGAEEVVTLSVPVPLRAADLFTNSLLI